MLKPFPHMTHLFQIPLEHFPILLKLLNLIKLPPLVPKIHLPEPLNKPAPSNHKSSTDSFHTANKPSGSQLNPIDMDLIPTHLVNLDSGLHQSWSNPNSSPHSWTCMRNGHTHKTCIWQGVIICVYFLEVSHSNKNCPTLCHDKARSDPSLNFCLLCGQPDIPLYNVEVYNTHSNPLQHLVACFPTSTDPSCLPNSLSLGYLEHSEGVMLWLVTGVMSLLLRHHMHTYFSSFNSIINHDSYDSLLYHWFVHN